MDRRVRVVKLSSILMIIALAVIGVAVAEDYWEQYESRTIREIVRIHRASGVFKQIESDKKAMLLTGDSFPSQVKIVYTGQTHPISDASAVLLQAWRKMLKDSAPPPDAFATQVLFREGAEEYWILVQKPLVEPLFREVKQGEVVNGYVIWVGAIKNKNKWEWLFAMNEFVPCPDPHQSCSF